MPNLDGTGPLGRGSQTGRGRGLRPGQRFNGRGQGMGGTEECVCSKCGAKAPHTRGVPCIQTECPKCGSSMAGIFCQPR